MRVELGSMSCGRGRLRPRLSGRWLALVFSFLCLGVMSCSGFKEIKLLTTPQEMAIGELMAQSVVNQFPILHDPVIEWYLNTRGRQLAELSHGPDFPYDFKVINTWEINAFALPGGHIFINLGLIETADSEAELLGVIAHEIGHAVCRHANERISQSQLVGIAGTIAFNQYYNQWAYLAANLFTQAGFLKMGRDAERESDDIGIRLLTASGYDPSEMTVMFQKLIEKQKRQPSRFEKLWLTHPPTPERIDYVNEEIKREGIDTTVLKKTTPEFEMIKVRIKELYPKPKALEKDERKEGDSVPSGDEEKDSAQSDEETASEAPAEKGEPRVEPQEVQGGGS